MEQRKYETPEIQIVVCKLQDIFTLKLGSQEFDPTMPANEEGF